VVRSDFVGSSRRHAAQGRPRGLIMIGKVMRGRKVGGLPRTSANREGERAHRPAPGGGMG